MSGAPEERSEDPQQVWVVDCPRHGRAKIVLDDIDESQPEVQTCSVFTGEVAPPCDRACLKQFDLKPRRG